MIRTTSTLTLLALLAGGCAEGGSEGGGNVPVVSGGEESATSPPADDGAAPDGDRPASDEGRPAPAPPSGQTGSAAIPATLYTGESTDEPDSFWRCYEEGVTDPEAYTSFLFSTDMSGGYFASGNSYEFTYTISADTIQMQVSGVEDSVQLLGVRFDGDFAFETNFRVGTRDNPLGCAKNTPGGQPIGGAVDPTNDDGASAPAGGVATVPGPAVPTTTDGATGFLNGTPTDIRDAWLCRVQNDADDVFATVLVSDGKASVAHASGEVYLTGWGLDASGDLLIADMRIASPRLYRSGQAFDSTRFVRGAAELGPIDCERGTGTGT